MRNRRFLVLFRPGHGVPDTTWLLLTADEKGSYQIREYVGLTGRFEFHGKTLKEQYPTFLEFQAAWKRLLRNHRVVEESEVRPVKGRNGGRYWARWISRLNAQQLKA